jgi:hypothetical protein
MDSHHPLLTPFDEHAFEQVVQANLSTMTYLTNATCASNRRKNPVLTVSSQPFPSFQQTNASQQQQPVFPNPLERIFFTLF